MPSISQIAAASYPAVLAKARGPHNQWAENAALRLFDKLGFIKRESLGSSIDVPIDFEANGDAAVLATAMTAVDITTETEVLSGATYGIAEISVPVKWSKKTEAMNPSVNQKVNVTKSLLTNGINSHDNLFEQALFSTSTNGLLGLQTLVADAGAGTVGTIDASSDLFWRNQVGSDYAATFTDIEAVFTALYNDCLKGTGSGMGPKLILSGSEPHSGFEGTQQANQRFVDTQEFKAGAKVLAFKDALYGFSQYGGSRVYMLSPEALEVRMSKEYNRHRGEIKEMDARNAFIMKIYTALQTVVTNRSRLGVTDVAP